jgi:hypothetical protein
VVGLEVVLPGIFVDSSGSLSCFRTSSQAVIEPSISINFLRRSAFRRVSGASRMWSVNSSRYHRQVLVSPSSGLSIVPSRLVNYSAGSSSRKTRSRRVGPGI